MSIWTPLRQSNPVRTAALPDVLSVRLRKQHVASGNSCFQLDTEFQVPPGVTILLGHSGAGKTTILQCIAGLSDPEQGRIAVGERVLFDSEKKTSVESARRQVAFVFQDLALFPHLTVGENVAYGLRRFDAAERERRTSRMLELFHIAHLRRRVPREISGGEQQRVALARSLVTEPSVLLLDEPLSSLDTGIKAGIIDDLRRWNEERRIPVLYVTHNHEEALALGERVIALEHGRIVAEGSPLEVVPCPRREAMAGFAGFDNLLDAAVVGLHEQQGTMTCRLTGTAVEIQAPLTRVALGATVRLGIRGAEILLASERPQMMGACNVIPVRLLRVERSGAMLEARVDCGAEVRVQLPLSSLESALQAGGQAWMIIRNASCHVIHVNAAPLPQRLLVFVCSGNTNRSPMAQAICRTAIARRLGVSLEDLALQGILVQSAGLAARSGAPMSESAQAALCTLEVPAAEHASRNLTAAMVRQAEAIICLTEQERRKTLEMFPAAAGKLHLLHPRLDIEDPSGQGPQAFLEAARIMQRAMDPHLDGLGFARA